MIDSVFGCVQLPQVAGGEPQEREGHRTDDVGASRRTSPASRHRILQGHRTPPISLFKFHIFLFIFLFIYLLLFMYLSYL